MATAGDRLRIEPQPIAAAHVMKTTRHSDTLRDMTLSEEVKARLRAEELFREEVRKELRGWLTKLSQPIVIWFLSTIVIGVISYGYSTISEDRQERSLNYKQALIVSREITFRIEQVDKLISDHNEASKVVERLSGDDLRDISDGKTLSDSGSSIQRYFHTAIRLVAVADLGGIVSFPLTGERDKVLGAVQSPVYGHSALPSGRGYQSDEFKNFALEDLWIEYHLLKSDERAIDTRRGDVREMLAEFGEASEPSDVITIIAEVSWGALSMSRVDHIAIKKMIEDVRMWGSRVIHAWDVLSKEVSV